MQAKTVSAILVWATAALLILNNFFKSEWIFLISIAMLIITVLIYLSPRLRK